MKETQNSEEIRQRLGLLAEEAEELISLTELLQSDGLRYERVLNAEEEANEL